MSQQTKVQAAEVTYELHSLGWKAFQNLGVTIVSEVWGQTVQSFADSKDGGRDGAFYGSWKQNATVSFQGTFTVQCKFSAKADKTLRISNLQDELEKAKRLAARGLADNYILLTNMHLTGVAEEEMRVAFEAIQGIKRFAAFGLDRISQIIRESRRLRMLVPRVYGLGDLSQILDERAYAQAQEILSAFGEDLSKFIVTDAYRRSAKALVEHGFVLLLGEPACGKSTIAAALSIGALDEWGCSTIKIRSADDFVKHWNPHEPKQLFWVDDAFGPTQLDRASTTAWNQVFPHMHAAIRRGAKVLFTSRDYIYRNARSYLKESAFPVMQESQVVINVQQLSRDEREQILYNHIRLGTQPSLFKVQIKPFLPDVAIHQRFSPEIARRFGNPAFTKDLTVSSAGLENFVANPMELLREVIRTLDVGARSALALVFMRAGVLPSPVRMSSEEERAVSLLGGSNADVRNALNALDGSLLSQGLQVGVNVWRFKHPTIRDAFASLVADDRELMDIYLVGTPIEKLFSEVSCGDVGIEGVKVIVPVDRYETITSRIEAFLKERKENRRAVHNFLSYRCDCHFLTRFIERLPKFIDSLGVSSYLYAISDVQMLVRLHEYGLLPEQKRLEVIRRLRDLAISVPDAGFLNGDIRTFFHDDELAEILEHVRENLLPKLDEHVGDWESEYSAGDDPEEHFDHLVDALKKLRETFVADATAVFQLDAALERIDGVVEELRSELPGEPDWDKESYGRGSSNFDYSDHRSIFDDVDH